MIWSRRARGRDRASLPPPQLFQLLGRFRPIFLQKQRQASVRQQTAASLASRAIVGFIINVANPLDLGAADRTGPSELSVNGHFRAKGGDLFRKLVPGLLTQQRDPMGERLLHGQVQPLNLIAGEFLRQSYWRNPGGVEDLVRVGIADAAEQTRVSQRAFNG